MWRALSLLVGALLAVGVYGLFAGGASAHTATPQAGAGPSSTDFGFALAAGAIALCAVLIANRPRMRLRR